MNFHYIHCLKFKLFSNPDIENVSEVEVETPDHNSGNCRVLCTFPVDVLDDGLHESDKVGKVLR